jgi:protein gp37
MAVTTKIEWCDHTFNPWRGCVKVSPGCAHCYAETLAKRNPKLLGEWGPDSVRAIGSESYWRQPVIWNAAAEKAGERRRVFCASLADVFEDRPELWEQRVRLSKLIQATPWLDWLLLTKRPENFKRMLWWTPSSDGLYEGEPAWPNVWLGVSVENQALAEKRIPLLLAAPAAVRFVSYEPALNAVEFIERFAGGGYRNLLDGQFYNIPVNGVNGHPDFTVKTEEPSFGKIDWLIVGGESGPNARPCNVEWIRSTVKQCRAAGVACFVKQLGSKPIGLNRDCDACSMGISVPKSSHGLDCSGPLKDKKGGDITEFPSDLRIREFPK